MSPHRQMQVIAESADLAVMPSRAIRDDSIDSELRRNLGCDEIQVVEIGEVEDLQIHPLSAGLLPLAYGPRHLVDGARHAVLAQLVGRASQSIGAAGDLSFVATHHGGD